MTHARPLRLFEGFGVELEYMIVDARTLDVKPVSDELIRSMAGGYVSEIEVGAFSWSNELAMHVIELKTAGPAARLAGLEEGLAEAVQDANRRLSALGGRLMPTAMHPWMNPAREMKLWAHEYSPVYEAMNRIFDCRGHGWANLQAAHLNLPFADDGEFARLHAAIRMVLPILPAIAASSPLMDGRRTEWMGNRLEVYRTNSKKIPMVTGAVIPEAVFSRAEYEAEIFRPLYEQIAPHDPEGVLQYEWLNARGAIARFDRHTIEIRVLDVQECPKADLAVLAAIVCVLRAIVQERWGGLESQKAWGTERLAGVYSATVRDAEAAGISDAEYLRAMGWRGQVGSAGVRAGELWRHLVEETIERDEILNSRYGEALNVILSEGTLARRIAKAVGARPGREEMAGVYGRLCECLAEGRMFRG